MLTCLRGRRSPVLPWPSPGVPARGGEQWVSAVTHPGIMPWFAGRNVPGAFQRLDSLSERTRQRYMALQPGQAEQLAGRAPAAYHVQAGVTLGGVPRGQAVPQPGRARDVDLTGHGGDGKSWLRS